MEFRKFEKGDIRDGIFEYFDEKWLLITAGTPGDYNTMTASWGGIGFIWEKPVFFIVVRKSRYTLEFLKKYDTFTCSYYGDGHKASLDLCGSKSGRDIDKAKEAGLTVMPVPGYDAVTFAEAERTFVCRKVLHQSLEESCFDDKAVFGKFYDKDEPHVLFIGTIEGFGA